MTLKEWRRVDVALAVLAFAVFLVHALNYAYFFIDDEAIPFVFARHLLEGKGLVYNSLEGRVEGYSDFLHVIAAAVYLWIARMLDAGPLSVLFVAKAVSFACGLATIVVLWSALRRHDAVRPQGAAAGLAFLALATPLALWSCSSLEMTPTALLVAVLTVSLWHPTPPPDRLIAVVACLLLLIRIDGIVFVVALLAPHWLLAAPDRRRTLLTRVVPPILATFLVFHAWRVWYFGDWLSTPIATKVLYKLHGAGNVVVRQPQAGYVVAFVKNYGIGAALAGTIALVVALRRHRTAWPLLASAGLLLVYAAIVGDWMPGFRFVLPALPVMTIVIALAISTIARQRLAWAAAMVACAWFSTAAIRGAQAYDALDYRGSWWRSPSLDTRRYFGPHLLVYEQVRDVIHPGALLAYDQAGFVPYMLDVDNIDALGLCSRFIARLPTTDVVFTEAGRYSPLTNAAALRVANAYLLYRAPDYILAPRGNIRAANRGELPPRILRGHYLKLFAIPHTPAVLYARSPEPLDEFRSSRRVFLENLAHPSHLRYAANDGVIPSSQYLARLPFLADGTLDRTFSGLIRYDVVFAETDEPIYELDVDGIWSRTAVDVALTLWSADGAMVRKEVRHVAANRPERVRVVWPAGIGAAQLTLALDTGSPIATRVMLRDLRYRVSLRRWHATSNGFPSRRPGRENRPP